ncbi:hypothetical protein, partial [Vibrio breoganii]
ENRGPLLSAIPNDIAGTEVHEVSNPEHNWKAQSDGRAHKVYFSKPDIWLRILRPYLGPKDCLKDSASSILSNCHCLINHALNHCDLATFFS